MSISLNSISKFETRVLPSILEYIRIKDELPNKLLFSFAALIYFYKGDRNGSKIELSDNPEVLETFEQLWEGYDYTKEYLIYLVERVLGNKEFWKQDLNNIEGLKDNISNYLIKIERHGMKKAVEEVYNARLCKINEIDNVLVALKKIKAGTIVPDNDLEIILQEDVLPGHKIAIKDIEKGDNIVKYGNPIGHAIKDIGQGEWVHSHNLKTNLSGSLEYEYTSNLNKIQKKDGPTTFQGYKRKNGDVGIRNELWIVPTVGCVNGVAELIINEFKREANPNEVDNVHVYKHNYGCSQLDKIMKTPEHFS